MSFRFMRAILFFDLPRDTYKQRKAATDFVKNLTKDGFIMLQESVYCKLSLNASGLSFLRDRIEKYKPKEGLISLLIVTEKQFSEMIMICGEDSSQTVHSVDRVVRL